MSFPAHRSFSWPLRLLLVFGLVMGAAVLGVLALRLAGLCRPYAIPSGGMAPTICRGDHVMAQGVSLLWRKPLRGEIVVFDAATVPAIKAMSPDAGGDWITRVVALPGDRCQIKEGKIWINGSAAPEFNGRQYLSAVSRAPGFPGMDLSKEVTVPPHEYIVLGDNTANSLDSRYWGFLPETSIKLLYLCHYYRSPDRSTVRPLH